jgi:hypothetical protein
MESLRLPTLQVISDVPYSDTSHQLYFAISVCSSCYDSSVTISLTMGTQCGFQKCRNRILSGQWQ